MKPDHTKQASLLAVENLIIEFGIGRGSKIHAVSDVSFNIDSGETLGLVGESGCGKSTLARAIVQLQKPTSGKIWFDGYDMTDGNNSRLRELRPRLQMIFQDAAASLNPARRVGRTISEPLRAVGESNRRNRRRKARALMQQVGLDPDQIYNRRPFEISIGQCQRISIARALITNPKLLVCDEPVSSLDMSVQAQILNLLERIKSHHELTMLFISHDLAVVKNICDRVAVMYMGKLCEIADSESLYQRPRHPYTAVLLASIPEIFASRDKREIDLRGVEIPSPAAPPSGCRFRTRCPQARQRCDDEEPVLEELGPGGCVACHYPLGNNTK
jgi:peptide/nickel transport system ATP-binding protein